MQFVVYQCNPKVLTVQSLCYNPQQFNKTPMQRSHGDVVLIMIKEAKVDTAQLDQVITLDTTITLLVFE